MGYNLKFTGQQIDNLLSKIEAMGESSTPDVNESNNIVRIYAPIPDMMADLGTNSWTLSDWETLAEEMEAAFPGFKQTDVYNDITMSFSHNVQAYQKLYNASLEGDIPLVIVDVTPFGSLMGWITKQTDSYFDYVHLALVAPASAAIVNMKFIDELGGASDVSIIINASMGVDSLLEFSLLSDGSVMDINTNVLVYIPEEGSLSDDQKLENKKFGTHNYKYADYSVIRSSGTSSFHINPIEVDSITESDITYNTFKYFSGLDLKEVRIESTTGETTVSTIATLNAIEN